MTTSPKERNSPKEKAKELVEKFTEPTEEWVDDESTGKFGWSPNLDNAKACALIAVDEIIGVLEQIHKPEYCIFIESYDPPIAELNAYEKIEFYQEVKEAINQL